jgi:hypothetical protein
MDGTREHRQRRTDSPEIEGARFGKAGLIGALEDVFECWIYQYEVSWSLNVDFDRVLLYTRDHIIIKLVHYEGRKK